MRALLVAPYLHAGGLERYATRVAEELARAGHAVTLVGHSDSPSDEVARGVRRVGVPYALRVSNTPLHPRLAVVLRGMLREGRFDVVNAHAPVPGAAEMARLAARRERVPFVLTYHGGNLAWLGRALAASAHTRIAVSPFVAHRVYGRLSSFLAPPGVDAQQFRPGGAPVPGRVLYVGPASRAYAWKGLDVLARAVERVPGASLRVVGDGDLAERYRRERGVDVVGRVDEDRLVQEYREASVVALPSLTNAESFGMVLAEANACGAPVVGSRMGGIPSFVRDGDNGLLARPGDVADLARALETILRDPDEARLMGARGRARVLREHRWEDVASRTMEAFRGAITAT